MARAAEVRDWEAGLEAFQSIEGEPSSISYGCLFHVADRCGKKEALAFYDKMKKAGVAVQVSTFTPLIRLAGRHGDLERAKSLLADLRAAQLQPNAHTYGALIGAHGFVKDAAGAQAAWREMLEAGIPPNPVSLTAVISAVASAGDLPAAEALLAQSAGTVSIEVGHLNCLLGACQRNGEADAALRLLQESRAQNIVPDVISYTCVLGALRKAKRPAADAERVVAEMRAAGVAPDAIWLEEFLGCLVSLFPDSRVRSMEELPREQLQRAAAVVAEAKEAGLQFTRRSGIIAEMLEKLLKHDDWVEIVTSGEGGAAPSSYYWNRTTGATQWERPDAPVSEKIAGAAAA